MKSGTARTLKTLVYLSIVGAGAYWAYGNILPYITRMLEQTGPNPNPKPKPTEDAQAVSGNAITDLSFAFANGFGDLFGALQKGFSDLGLTGAAIDGEAEATLETYYDPARRAAAQKRAEAAFTYDPGTPTGHGSGAGRSWLDPDELKRRLALSEQLQQGSYAPRYTGGGGLYLTQ